MAEKDVAILDFGSQSLKLLIGRGDVNNAINVKGFFEEKYEGFMDGEFLDEKNLDKVVASVISKAEKACDYKITTLTIGVPTEFCFSSCKNVSQTYIKPKKITQKDVDALYDKVTFNTKTHMVINRDAIYFVLGENNRVSSPIGKVDSKITACFSFILADNKFIDKVIKSLIKCKVENFSFVSSAYAQGLYLFDSDTRDRYALLVDCGYITTTVALYRGRGILNLSSFSLGSGHICADLSSLLKIPFESSESLFKKVVLCISPEESDTYDIMLQGRSVPVSMKVANAIVESRIEVIARGVQKCFSLWQYDFPDFIPVNLTGGGISLIKGGKDYLAKILGKNVEVAKMPFSQYSKVNNSSCMAVLNYAIYNNLGGKNV